MEMTCFLCDFVAVGETEKDVKNCLQEHFKVVHKTSSKDFSILYADMKDLAKLFKPLPPRIQ